MSLTKSSSTQSPSDGRLFFEPCAEVDPLTKLIGRRSFFAQIDLSLRTSAAAGIPSSLILIDLDRLKTVNDGYGPEFGDALLALVADRIRSLVDGTAIVARVSGDGFGVFLPGLQNATLEAERLCHALSRPFTYESTTVVITASVGSAVATNQYIDAGVLVHRSGLALHQAQALGGGRYQAFEPRMETRAKHSNILEQDLRMAVRSSPGNPAFCADQFEIHYQPQVKLADGSLTGFEALLRWRHPVRGWISPAEFIPVAEETGLIPALGNWVLREACSHAKSWPLAALGRPLRVSVNVSPLQLSDEDSIVEAVKTALFDTGLPANRLEIEITESALMGGASETLRSLKRLGISLALDDFGTGFSSLSQLGRHPFDRLKIDRSFLVGTADPASDQSSGAHSNADPSWMIRAIAALGAGLGMETIVEGVETAEQVALVTSAGCTEMQGYLVSRPVPEADVASLIQNFITNSPNKNAHAINSCDARTIPSLPPTDFCKARMCAYWKGNSDNTGHQS